jgi:hypothetical protein
MTSVQYKAKSGKTQFMPTLEHVQEMIEDNQGFCLACGETQDGVEPDARRYKCECCGEEKSMALKTWF